MTSGSRRSAIKKILRGVPCKHQHLSGRRCTRRVFTPTLVKGEKVMLCELHTAACAECAAMLAAFPLRKDVTHGNRDS